MSYCVIGALVITIKLYNMYRTHTTGIRIVSFLLLTDIYVNNAREIKKYYLIGETFTNFTRRAIIQYCNYRKKKRNYKTWMFNEKVGQPPPRRVLKKGRRRGLEPSSSIGASNFFNFFSQFFVQRRRSVMGKKNNSKNTHRCQHRKRDTN